MDQQQIKQQRLKIEALMNQINSQGGSNQDNDKLILQLREQLKSANDLIKKNNLQFESKLSTFNKEKLAKDYEIKE